MDGWISLASLPARWNISPTRDIYAVREDQQSRARELATASWGLIGTWHRGMASARASQARAINARRESIFDKPTFRDAVRKRRCLVPADGYHEWVSPKGQIIRSVAIITCDSAGESAAIHSRMPVILPKDRWEF